ncbi:hypothetical protein MMC25_004713 [Agyrium rufum]|nr:hypothetical protein [Agyrium rufum]
MHLSKTPRKDKEARDLAESTWVIDPAFQTSSEDYREEEEEGDDDEEEPNAEPVSASTRQGQQRKSDNLRNRRTPSSAFARDAGPDLVMPSLSYTTNSGNLAMSRTQSKPRSRVSRTMTLKATPVPVNTERGVSIIDRTHDSIWPVVSWVGDVLAKTLNLLKSPISYMICAYVLFVVMIFLRNALTSSIYATFAPVCQIPGVSYLRLDICQATVMSSEVTYQDHRKNLDQFTNVQSGFEEILERTAGGASLPLEMKRSEASIRDLLQVVRFSKLHSRHELIVEFTEFIDNARKASFDLQKFNSHIGRGVDAVLTMTRFTKRGLESIGHRDASRGALEVFINHYVLALLRPTVSKDIEIIHQYLEHSRFVEDEISRLVDEAQLLLMDLQNLEGHLDVIHAIVVRHDEVVKVARDELLSHLWTMLGGNKQELGSYQSQLQMLHQVNEYRRSAFAHVSGTIIRLQAMGAELEELRERVASVRLLRDVADLPLSVHIENIELGVERLEAVRRNSKKIESTHIQETLGRDQSDQLNEENLLDG